MVWFFLGGGAFIGSIFIQQLEIGNRMGERGSDTQQRPQAGNRTWGRRSEDQASAYGMPALPTELNSAQ